MREIVDKLEKNSMLSDDEFRILLLHDDCDGYLAERADSVRRRIYGNDVYIRGLIEFTNYCKNDCFYCGIRKSNKNAQRYRLTKMQIMECCKTGYAIGMRTFVLQGGEDVFFNDERLCGIVSSIKREYPDCAVTLSVGERSGSSYKNLFDAGADRYLLRHETADSCHYSRLHPEELSLENRIECLNSLKKTGFQVGCGFMVGSPWQTAENIISDLKFIRSFEPHMVGIGPFIPHHDTPFRDFSPGSADLTVKILSIVRLLLPKVLLPATTALGTAEADGRERGILAGANVVMPNLSPVDVRKKYLLYDNKISTGDEAAEGYENLKKKIRSIGYNAVSSRGDFIDIQNNH